MRNSVNAILGIVLIVSFGCNSKDKADDKAKAWAVSPQTATPPAADKAEGDIAAEKDLAPEKAGVVAEKGVAGEPAAKPAEGVVAGSQGVDKATPDASGIAAEAAAPKSGEETAKAAAGKEQPEAGGSAAGASAQEGKSIADKLAAGKQGPSGAAEGSQVAKAPEAGAGDKTGTVAAVEQKPVAAVQGPKLPPGASMSPEGEYIPPPFRDLDDTPADQKARRNMVKWLGGRERTNQPSTLRAMAAVPRQMYMKPEDRKDGYTQSWFRIGYGQTITDPATVARMTQILAIKPTDKVLEIGTGSGYQGSVLAQLTPNVYSIEIVEPLANRTWALLDRIGYGPEVIHRRLGDGYFGWLEEGPFDKIIVTCAADHIPIPLIQQLKPGGLMVIPVGPRYQPGKLYLVAKDQDGKIHKKVLGPAQFVPMTRLTEHGKEDPRAKERNKLEKEGRKEHEKGSK